MPVQVVKLSEPRELEKPVTEERFCRAIGSWTRLLKKAFFKVWRCTTQLSFSIQWGRYRESVHLHTAAEEAALQDAAQMDQLSQQFEGLSLEEAAECGHFIHEEDL